MAKKLTTILVTAFMATVSIHAQSYKSIHDKAVLVDTHNDILTTAINKGYSIEQNLAGKTYTDLTRMKEGGLDVQIFSVFCDGFQKNPFAFANMQIDTLYAWIARNPTKMMLVKTPADLEQAIKTHKLASLIGVEGGHMIEDKIENLDVLFNRGARYMTLTWNNSTSWASSAWAETLDTLHGQKKGLNDFGKEIVKHMNALGMLVDLSHVGEQTFYDAINTSTKPILVSHSCVYSLCPVPRNMKDDQIRAVGKNGGVIHLNFYSGFIDSTYEGKNKLFNEQHKTERDSLLQKNPDTFFAEDYLYTKYKSEVQAMRPPLSKLLDHLDYIVKLIGVDHVGLGSDFDGAESTPQGLDGVEDYPKITKALLERGYSKQDVEKILGGNFIRVFKANAVSK
jgi:membrane dipeptidase